MMIKTIDIVNSHVNIITPLTDERCDEMYRIMEYAGRTCYQSVGNGNPVKFISGIVNRGHESVIEHCSVTVEFVTDRGVTHELVRHRVAAYSQESTRYVKYDDSMKFIMPIEFVPFGTLDVSEITDMKKKYDIWFNQCQSSALAYRELIKDGASPQTARSVLNNSLKTSIVVTFNLREWRHVLKMRCSVSAHPHIKEVMIPLLLYFRGKFPGIFDDIEYDEKFYNNLKPFMDDKVYCPWEKITEEEKDSFAEFINNHPNLIDFMKAEADKEKEDKCDNTDTPHVDYLVEVAFVRQKTNQVTCRTKMKVMRLKGNTTIRIIPFNRNGNIIRLMASIRCYEDKDFSEIIEIAKKIFIDTLNDVGEAELIPLVEKFKLQR